MKLLVTGALGFIGGSVARRAARQGHTVVGTSRVEDPVPQGGAGFPILVADSPRALASSVRTVAPDVVFHAAGRASVGASLSAPDEDFEGSVLPWQTLLEAVRGMEKRPRLLFPSSAAVYGNPLSLPVAEDAPLAPISPYGYHKRVCEILADEYACCFGLDVTVVRLFSVFGAAQRRLLIWELFVQLIGGGDRAFLDGTGQETRDFLHVDDLADALLAVAERPREGGLRGADVINVASGEERTVLSLAESMRDIVAPAKEIGCRGHERPGDPGRWRADIGRLRSKAPAWRPRGLEEALRSVVADWHAGPISRLV
jgi:UDP-glucose 4-epimerase